VACNFPGIDNVAYHGHETWGSEGVSPISPHFFWQTVTLSRLVKQILSLFNVHFFSIAIFVQKTIFKGLLQKFKK